MPETPATAIDLDDVRAYMRGETPDLEHRVRFICTTETDETDALALEACELLEAGVLISHRDVLGVRS